MPVAALGRMPKSTPGRPIRLCGRNLGRSFPPGEMCSAAYQERDGSPARLFRRVRKTGIIRAAISPGIPIEEIFLQQEQAHQAFVNDVLRRRD